MYESLPLYDCHKKVRAAKILDRDNDVLVLEIPGSESGSFIVTIDDDYLSRCPKLSVGGYFVVYQEGDEYTSYSPPGPFEGEYTLIDEEGPNNPDKSTTIETVAQRRRLTALSFAVDLHGKAFRQPVTDPVADAEKVIIDAQKYLDWLEKE